MQFSNLEPKFCYNLDLDQSNHKFTFKFEFCAKKKRSKKRSFAFRVLLVFTYLYFKKNVPSRLFTSCIVQFLDNSFSRF